MEMTIPNATIPGPRGHFLLGSIPDIMRDRLQFLVDLQRDYGDVVRIRFGPIEVVGIFHPEAIQRVLQDNHKNYSKETRTYASLSLLVGNGLISSNGDFWLRQRRLMQPAFHRNADQCAERDDRAANPGNSGPAGSLRRIPGRRSTFPTS